MHILSMHYIATANRLTVLQWLYLHTLTMHSFPIINYQDWNMAESMSGISFIIFPLSKELHAILSRLNAPQTLSRSIKKTLHNLTLHSLSGLTAQTFNRAADCFHIWRLRSPLLPEIASRTIRCNSRTVKLYSGWQQNGIAKH